MGHREKTLGGGMIITIGRKPFKGAVIDNVMKNHCGGINIDPCRITFQTDGVRKETKRTPRDDTAVWTDKNSGMKKENSLYADADPRGRFPANVLFSESVTHHLPKATQGHWANAKVTGYGDRIGSGTVEYPDVGEKDQSGGSVAKYFFILRGV